MGNKKLKNSTEFDLKTPKPKKYTPKKKKKCKSCKGCNC